jgi:hypothetical protein
MRKPMTVHPKNMRGRLLLSRNELFQVETRLIQGKPTTLLVIGDLPTAVRLDESELSRVEDNSELK